MDMHWRILTFKFHISSQVKKYYTNFFFGPKAHWYTLKIWGWTL